MTLKAHMDIVLTIIVNFASPPARRALGSVNEKPQKPMEKTLNHLMTFIVIIADSLLKPKAGTI